MMATNRLIALIMFQPFADFILTGVIADSSAVNVTLHSINPTSFFATQHSLISTSSNSKYDQTYTHNSSFSSQQYSTQVISTKFSKSFSYLESTSATPTLYQFTTSGQVSIETTLLASQTVSTTPKAKSNQRRYRSSDDVYSISVLLFISGICAIILLAFFVKVLIDSKKRNRSFKEIQ